MMSFSDATIRRFLLAQLSPTERSTFELRLFTDSSLVQRARLAEFELIDEYAAGRLSAKQRLAFQQKFLVAAERQGKLEVSTALANSLAGQDAPSPVGSPAGAFAWPRLAWKVAFAIIALAVVLAGALVIRKEPEFVRQIIPKRRTSAPKPAPTPVAAHHPRNQNEAREHRDEQSPLPAHEASTETIVLSSDIPADQAPVISLASGSNVVRLELKVDQTEAATFGLTVTADGQVVYSVPEIPAEHADRIDIDVPVERLKPGVFQVTLTRLNTEPAASTVYYFRVR